MNRIKLFNILLAILAFTILVISCADKEKNQSPAVADKEAIQDSADKPVRSEPEITLIICDT